MSQPAIKVENLSKLYRIGTRHNKADTLREKLTHAIAAPFRRLFGRNGHGNAGDQVIGSSGNQVPITDDRPPITDAGSPITDHPLPVPITDHRSPITPTRFGPSRT